MAWFYSAGGEQKGPVEAAEFESLIAMGLIRPETLVWQPGMPAWQMASTARPDLLPPALASPLAAPVYGGTPMYGGNPAPPVAGGRYAGFWIRFAARMIDGFILSIPTVLMIVLSVVLFLGVGFMASGRDSLDRISPFAIIGGVLTALVGNMLIQAMYECYMMTTHGATLGKMALGLKVITLDGERLQFRQALIRFAWYPGIGIIGIIPLVGMLVSIYILVDAIVLGTDARKQALHDRYAKTFVVFK
jgi:uncharacterized RDD family membrane protein YckC